MTRRQLDDARRRHLMWLGVAAVGAVVAVGWAVTLPQTLLREPSARRTIFDEVRQGGSLHLGAPLARLRQTWQAEERALLGSVTSTPDGVTADAGGRFFFRLPGSWEVVAREDGLVVGRSASGTLEVRYPAAVTEVPIGAAEPLTVDGTPATMVSDGTTATVVAKRLGGYLLVKLSSPGLNLDTVRELAASIRFTKQP